MARGSQLSGAQVRAAIDYNKALYLPHLPLLRAAVSVVPTGNLDEEFVRAVAEWQELYIGPGQGDGKLGPKTEAHLGIQHPKALLAVTRAEAIFREGNNLFDSWFNDARDNNNDGVTDGPHEKTADGAHYGKVYPKFGLIKGTYTGLGFDKNLTCQVKETRTVLGPFRYLVCADVVSRAYSEVGVMAKTRSAQAILDVFRRIGYVWRKSDGYPSQFLPGDYICTSYKGDAHAGIVTVRSNSKLVPEVIEMPGPSTLLAEGTYDPSKTNDVRKGPWSKARVPIRESHYLGRLLISKCR